MLFTWSTQNLCIVFRSWHITGPVSLLLSLLAIVALSAGYELVRELARKYEERHSGRIQAFGNGEFLPRAPPSITPNHFLYTPFVRVWLGLLYRVRMLRECRSHT
jgi:hypothetical protein